MNDIEIISPLFPVLSGLGSILIFAALATLVFSYRKEAASAPAPELKEMSPTRHLPWLLVLILVGGAVLRLGGLEDKTLDHVEAYIPRIDLPVDISVPPPRHDFLETVSWHFHYEPHPVPYFVAMWGWTGLFGTSLEALRLPTALLALASIIIIYRIGYLSYGRTVGLVAAGFLAFSGFHIYWSQVSRMYIPGCFFGLVATWALYEITTRRGRAALFEALYVCAMFLGTSTVVFFWPFFLIHIFWAMTQVPATPDGVPWTLSAFRAKVPRLAYLLALSGILSAPNALHVVYMSARPLRVPPSMEFLRDYFSFGFLIKADEWSLPLRTIPTGISLVVFALAALLLIRGMMTSRASNQIQEEASVPPLWILAVAATGMTFVMIGLAFVGTLRTNERLMVSVLPALALLIPVVIVYLGPLTRRCAATLENSSALLRSLLTPIGLLAVVPTLVLFAASYQISVVAPRAFQLFVPYLLILLAVGTVSLASRRWLAAPLAASLIGLFGFSIWHFKQTPNSSVDYQAIAAQVNDNLEPGDLIFAKANAWDMTPIFYFFDNSQIVAVDYAGAVDRNPSARIWVVLIGNDNLKEGMRAALDANFVPAAELKALRARAILYTRNPSAEISEK